MRQIASRLMERRRAILEMYPFYGRLLLHLPFTIEDCETAYTNGKIIAFDPKFIKNMPDVELDFLILHEVMHCVLCHCMRSRGKLGLAYNIACDIVVNSLLCDMFTNPFYLNGSEVMHLTPNGKEGKLYTAEQVYDMLVKNGKTYANSGGKSPDEHKWDDCDADGMGESVWRERILDAARRVGAGNVPLNLKRQIDELNHTPKISWREVLCSFIKNDRADFDFMRPDRRFLSGDFLLPSFQEDMYGESVRDIWFAVDASGSVTDALLSEVMNEIRGAIAAVDSLKGLISFFDVNLTPPVPFENREELSKVEIRGGGGTDFNCIFKGIDKFFTDSKPCAIIIMTDGMADFPKEYEAQGIPVLWVICGTGIRPDWGEVINI